MSDELANFRELTGIGPATEAELHEAGVRTWTSLAAVLTALARVRGVAGDALRALRDNARDLASEATPAADAGPAPDTGPTGADPTGAASDPTIATVPTPPLRAPAPVPARHRLRLDAGKAVGGRRDDDIDLTLSTADLADVEAFSYRARLVGRSYGDPDGSWTTIGRDAGRAVPPRQVPLHFAHVELAPGLHRLRLEVDVTWTGPAPTTPTLAIV